MQTTDANATILANVSNAANFAAQEIFGTVDKAPVISFSPVNCIVTKFMDVGDLGLPRIVLGQACATLTPSELVFCIGREMLRYQKFDRASVAARFFRLVFWFLFIGLNALTLFLGLANLKWFAPGLLNLDNIFLATVGNNALANNIAKSTSIIVARQVELMLDIETVQLMDNAAAAQSYIEKLVKEEEERGTPIFMPSAASRLVKLASLAPTSNKTVVVDPDAVMRYTATHQPTDTVSAQEDTVADDIAAITQYDRDGV